MCGINGIISDNKSLEKLKHIEIMNDAISHRGPDSCGLWGSGDVAMGHVRLSILDLSERGNQPFEKSGLVIVFNGEIYNFKELKGKLKHIDFISDSDTEVVLEMWREYGSECLQMLRGMFVFSIHNELTGQTFIVRDHFGIKPLFYFSGDDMFVFSSELKAMELVLNDSLTVDSTAMAASLLYVWVPEKQSIYKEVKKLLPGSMIEVSAKGCVKNSVYWRTQNLVTSPVKKMLEGEAVELLDEVIESSVKAHLVSDVPVNAFLSGGLDSSLLVAMARKHLPQIDCFTIKFSEADKRHESMVDDTFYAEKVAKQLDVKLTTIEVKPSLIELLPKIVHHLDEPIGDSAAINTYLICEAAHKMGVKVLLSGMGADEMFAGYRKHYANLLACKYRKIPVGLRGVGESIINSLDVSSLSSGNKLVRWAKRFISFAGLEEADAFFRSYTYYDLAEMGEAFCDGHQPNVELLKMQHHELFGYARAQRNLVDAMCYTDVNHFMVSLNLAYTDRASMAASTEVRVPFIDTEVVKAAFSIDSSLKLKSGQQKYILKKVAEKWLPRDVIYRPKASFTMPLRSWIRNDLSGMVDDYLLSQGGLSGRQLIKPKFIKRLVDDEMAGRCDNAQKIWQLLTLEQWLRNKGM